MPRMVDALRLSGDEVRRIYDRRSRHYARTVGRLERRAHLRALELARISPDDKVLEVAVGPGTTLVEILAKVDGANVVHGVDISSGMLRQAARTAAAAGYQNFELRQADARQLPYPDQSFDLVYNGYMLDLMSLGDIRAVLAEFHRVLRPGGRLVFSVTHPIRWAFPDEPGPEGLSVSGSYFDRTPYVEQDDTGHAVYVEHHRTLGDRVRDVVSSGFRLVDLVEPEWPAWNTTEWGGWSPLRGGLIPGTAVFVCERD